MASAFPTYKLLPPQSLYACQVSSEVMKTTSEWLALLVTTNGIWFSSLLLSVR